MSRCSHCGYEARGKPSRCASCRKFGTFQRVQKLSQIPTPDLDRVTTGTPVDDLLGGGFVRGLSYRLSGTPGAGKSTVALAWIAAVGGLYETSEETLSALRSRANRTRLDVDTFFVAETTSVEDIISDAEDLDVPMVVVDSVHRLQSSTVNGPPGCVAQVGHAVVELTRFARARNVVVLFIAHVTKDGTTAGPRGSDHDCDGCLFMHHDDGAGEIEVEKHRHGPAFVSLTYRHEADGVHYDDEEDGLPDQDAIHDAPRARVLVRAEEEGVEEEEDVEEAAFDEDEDVGEEEDGVEEEEDEAQSHAAPPASARRSRSLQAQAVTR